jgi:hypothetical protein
MQLERLVAAGPAAPRRPSVNLEHADDDSGGVLALGHAGDLGVSGLCAELSGSAPKQQQQECHVHKYSVVWHAIYRVPVLYIAASRTGEDMCMTGLQAVQAQYSFMD